MVFRRVEPGLEWEPSRTKDDEGRTIGTARVEIIKRGTRGRVRKRLTLERTTLDAAEKRAELERARLNGDTTPPPETFGEFVDQYGQECLDRVGPGTRRGYESAIKNHIRPFFEKTPLVSFAKRGEYEVDRFKDVLRVKRKLKFLRGRGVVEGATTLTPQTINGVLRLLRLLLNHARKAGVISTLPKDVYKPVREPRRDHTVRVPELIKFFQTFDDEATFRRAANQQTGQPEDPELLALHFEKHRWLKPFFIFCADTGWRRGDVLRLRWSDIGDSTVSIVMEKTGEPAVAGITTAMREAIDELKGRRVVSKTHVFLGWRGRPLSATAVRRAFANGMELAGIEKKRKLHGFRHGVAARLAAANVPSYVIQLQLGHADVRTTELYLQGAKEHVDQATVALNQTTWRKG